MSKIETFEEMEASDKWDDYGQMAREFARRHVKAALEAAAKNAKIIDDPNSYTGNTGSEYPPDQIVSEKSILSAYPLNLIE